MRLDGAVRLSVSGSRRHCGLWGPGRQSRSLCDFQPGHDSKCSARDFVFDVRAYLVVANRIGFVEADSHTCLAELQKPLLHRLSRPDWATTSWRFAAVWSFENELGSDVADAPAVIFGVRLRGVVGGPQNGVCGWQKSRRGWRVGRRQRGLPGYARRGRRRQRPTAPDPDIGLQLALEMLADLSLIHI